MINEKNFFEQPVKNDLRTYDNIQKILTGQGDIKQLVVYQITNILINTVK